MKALREYVEGKRPYDDQVREDVSFLLDEVSAKLIRKRGRKETWEWVDEEVLEEYDYDEETRREILSALLEVYEKGEPCEDVIYDYGEEALEIEVFPRNPSPGLSP